MKKETALEIINYIKTRRTDEVSLATLSKVEEFVKSQPEFSYNDTMQFVQSCMSDKLGGAAIYINNALNFFKSEMRTINKRDKNIAKLNAEFDALCRKHGIDTSLFVLRNKTHDRESLVVIGSCADKAEEKAFTNAAMSMFKRVPLKTETFRAVTRAIDKHNAESEVSEMKKEFDKRIAVLAESAMTEEDKALLLEHREKKMEAVRRQDYESAAKLRHLERGVLDKYTQSTVSSISDEDMQLLDMHLTDMYNRIESGNYADAATCRKMCDTILKKYGA